MNVETSAAKVDQITGAVPHDPIVKVRFAGSRVLHVLNKFIFLHNNFLPNDYDTLHTAVSF